MEWRFSENWLQAVLLISEIAITINIFFNFAFRYNLLQTVTVVKSILPDCVLDCHQNKFVVSSLSEFHKTLTSEQKSILIDKLETFDKWHSYFGE